MAKATITPGLRLYDAEIYAALLKAAAQAGRSLNEELNVRLVASVKLDRQRRGGADDRQSPP